MGLDYDWDPERPRGGGGFVAMVLIIILTVTVVPLLVGCGPHKKSPAEIRHEHHVAVVQAAAKKKHDAAQKAAEARLKAAQQRAANAAKPALPPGIEQMDSTHFFVHRGFEGNTRDICRTDAEDSPAGIDSITPYGRDMIITCRNAEHGYRHAPFTTNPVTTPQPAPAK